MQDVIHAKINLAQKLRHTHPRPENLPGGLGTPFFIVLFLWKQNFGA